MGWGEGVGVRVRRIAVDYASHTSHVELLEGELGEVLGEVRGVCPRVPLFSTVDGEWVEDGRMGGEYWYRNLRQPVRFGAAMEALAADGFRVFVEASAHPVLTVGVQEALETAGGVSSVVTGTLRRDDGGMRRFLTSAGELWTRGVEVDWSTVLPHAGGPLSDLPTYPFQHRRYWLETTSRTRHTAKEDLTMDDPANGGDGPDAAQEPQAETLTALLAGASEEERAALLLERVRAEAAAVLGHDDPAPIDGGGVFFQIGFTSLTAVELRNRLSAATGFELPIMLLFDHPTPAALAEHLGELYAADDSDNSEERAGV
ncbi:acyltransferase domain-containing protein [Streptomyces sp. NPDC006012]|uniref:acyltransferase domain-containing protein n=1 Tax=Streptomyces sp. NPDC006012 TaxID=3364739 RepID=UPI0036A4A486